MFFSFQLQVFPGLKAVKTTHQGFLERIEGYLVRLDTPVVTGEVRAGVTLTSGKLDKKKALENPAPFL